MKKKKFLLITLIIISIVSYSYASIVSDNDGSAFVTKAEFDALKKDFNEQIDNYNTSIDGKIDGAISQYLAGYKLTSFTTEKTVTGYDSIVSIGKDNIHKYASPVGKLTINHSWQRGSNSTYTMYHNWKGKSKSAQTYEEVNLFTTQVDVGKKFIFNGRKNVTWNGDVVAWCQNTATNRFLVGAIGTSLYYDKYKSNAQGLKTDNAIISYKFNDISRSPDNPAVRYITLLNTDNTIKTLNYDYWTGGGGVSTAFADWWAFGGINYKESSSGSDATTPTGNFTNGITSCTIIDDETVNKAIMYYKKSTDINEPWFVSDQLPVLGIKLDRGHATSRTNPLWDESEYTGYYGVNNSSSAYNIYSIADCMSWSLYTPAANKFFMGDPVLPVCFDADPTAIVYQDYMNITKDGEEDTSSVVTGEINLTVGIPLVKISAKKGTLIIPFDFVGASGKKYKVWVKHGPFPTDKTTIVKSECLEPAGYTLASDGSFIVDYTKSESRNLKFEVVKGDLLYVYFTEDGKEGGGELKIPKELTLELPVE